MKTAQVITLRSPVGINNYSGEAFRCFTRGDTLPFEFTFKDPAGDEIDITDWRLFISFSGSLNCNDPGCSTSALVIEVEIPIVDALAGQFAGTVNDESTLSIPCGIVYGSIKYINASNETFILDMCQLEVYPNVNPSLH